MRQGFFKKSLALGVLIALAPGIAHAETRALIVGVSDYPNLAKSIWLTGPRNDSREFANTIVRLGVPAVNVTVLADGVENLEAGIATPGPGTKVAILDGLTKLAETSNAGDLVVFYFSGHGSQQPDRDGDDQGGRDEVFLPYDTAAWTSEGIGNAIIDDELRTAIDKIRAKGVDFFGVIDACHSATGFRAVPGDAAKARKVDPRDLGAPEVNPSAARPSLTDDMAPTTNGGRRGRAAFFYAAQESEEALEKPPAKGEDGQNFGVFTYTLLKRMNATPNLTYRTLHQAVMADIKRDVLAPSQTPDAEGDLLDEPVLQLSAAPVRQWPIYNGKLQAGALHGVTAGSTIALFADPADSDDKALATAIVEEAAATRSIVVPSAGVEESAFKAGRFARLLDPAIDLSFTLSEPIRLDPDDGHDYAPALAALHSAIDSKPVGARMSVRQNGYDLAIGLVDGKLAFAATAGAIDENGDGSSPRLTLPSDPAAATQAVSDALKRIGKVMALQRLGGDSAGLKPAGLETALLVSKARPSAKTANGCSRNSADFEPPAPAGDVPAFDDCDIITVDMRNAGRKPIDVTALLVGADYSITQIWPQGGASSRILAAESKTARVLQMRPDPATGSDERIIFVGVPGVNRANVVFDNLQQEGVRAGDEPEIAAIRNLVANAMNDVTRATAMPTKRIEEEMSVDVKPFHVRKDGT